MANIPKKSPDSAEDALHAIQEALSTGQPERRGATPVISSTDISPDPGAATDLFQEPQPDDWEPGAPRPVAANDDRASVGAMLQAMRHRSTRTPYIVAGVAAVLWAAGGLAIAYLYSGDLAALFAIPRIGVAAVVGLASAILVPVIFFLVLAHMFRRSQDMRLVAETMAEVAMRLAQPETAAREQIVNVGQAIRREVTAMGDGVERALARAAELESLVHNEVSALERAYNDNEVRIRELLKDLTNQRETLVNQAEHVRNAIAGVHLDLSHDISSVGDLVADKVGEVAQRVTRSLTEKGEHITLALGHAGDSIIDTLTERGSSMLDRLETSSERASTAIASASDQLTASLTFKTENVHSEFAGMAAELQQMMTARLDQVAQGFQQKSAATIETMATRSQAFNDALTQTGSQMAQTIAARAEEVNATLRTAGDALANDLGLRGSEVVAKLEQTGARVNDTVVSRGSAVADTFRQNAEALAQVLSARGDAVKDLLAARLQAFEDMFNQGGTALTEKVSREANTLGSLITRHMTEFDRTVKTYGGELVDRLGQRTQDVSEAMRNYLDSFDQRVTTRAGDLTGSLDVRLSQFEETLGSRVSGLTDKLTGSGQQVIETLDGRISAVTSTINACGTEVADTISAKIAQIDQTLGARALEVATTLDSRVERFEDLLVGRTETVTNALETRTKAAADALHARLEQLGQSIKTNSAEAERSIDQIAVTTTETIRTSAGEVERTLLGVSAEVARNFVGKAEEIATSVTQRTSEMTAVLSDKSGSVLAAITEKGEQFASEVTRAADQAVKSIEDKGFAFTRTMLDNSSEISRMINSAGENASNTVNRTLNDLNDTALKAIETSKTTAAATVSEMLETHNMLRADTTALFERLREANIMLQEVLSGSHENMTALENTLVMRVSEFVTAMTDVNAATGDATARVEQNIAGFRDITTRVLGDLNQLAIQFDSHGRSLASAAEAIERSNQRTDESINERRVSLDSLVATLDIRTEDLDQRLKRFSGLLDESLEAASTRARDIARIVSESAAEGSRAIGEQYDSAREHAEEERRRVAEQYGRIRETAEDERRRIAEQYERLHETAEDERRQIGEQYERIRETAEDERRRTAESMRSTYEQTAGDTHAMFREANDRFAEAVKGMKQMAAEMQRELEATRAELHRGIFELPQETAESAGQMRRVIVDQIEALAELNRIVARHGRNLDAVEPRRPVREETSVTASIGSRVDPQPLPPPPRSAAPRSTDAASFAPASRRVEAAAPNPAQAAATRGWLTELLNRASEGEATRDLPREPQRDLPREPAYKSDERTPRHSIESLDSLSVDIARMIDHDAAADLWDRYKRGERNVFTRRLYTLQGQQAFDEIRKKYRADREFKLTVDRYIGEFEHLLDEVARDDRGQVVARTYLTSETGKVYTMLAHAAGRFD